ncbi:tetratricopeptide repeat protein [Lewinella sp. IMCC34183]|uniref:tetratricopeptide repeat protein n=1 Tax=Lewinella sp. IMCC34183 TaxID=2248762 RepID=UPI000E289210|nr:tetratricopeptide repeat protein [Lewinella sp. IMCC34183]
MPTDLPPYRRFGLQAAALAGLACVLYLNTLGHGFVLDDAIVITDNSVVQRGVAGWGDLFTHDTFYGFFGEQQRDALVAGGRYRPLTPALFSLEYGAGGSPFPLHLLNVLWYAGLVVVVFGLVAELTREADLPWWVPLGAAALFAVHPIHTEAVANIKGRDEILALLGAAAAAWLVLRAARGAGGWGHATGAGLLLFLGCLAKENAITFVAVLPLLLFVTGRRGYRYLIPAGVGAGAFLLLRYAIIGGVGEPGLELMNNPFLREVGGRTVALNAWERLPTVAYTGLVYLRLLFFPVGLVHDYYPAAIELRNWTSPGALISIFLHAALLFWGAGHLRARHRFVAAGLLIYLITLSIVSNLVFPVGTLMSERFLFMPSLGFCLAVAAGLGRRRRAGAVIVAVLVVIGSVLTVARNPVWQDNYTLFTTDVTRQPRSAKLRNAAAGARLDRYQALAEEARAARPDLLRQARTDLDTALAIHPRYGNAHLLRGNANFLAGDYDAAIADYHRAAEYGVARGAVDQNLVVALQRAGRAAGEERQDLTAALAYLRQAEQLDGANYETLRLLGLAYGMSGRTKEAADYFARALALQPDNEGAQRNLEIARQQLRATDSGN